jgi:2-methylisocitrate lyase-like PEP mutase family enzyme
MRFPGRAGLPRRRARVLDIGIVTRLADAATRLAALHVPGKPVVLPNVWDAASASAAAGAGFPAVATSSGAVAATLGYEDHEKTPADEVFAAIARICRVVSVPVTVDLEAGYGLPAPELVRRLLDAGAVGCNIEDTDHRHGERKDVDVQSDYLAAVNQAAREAGVPLVLNARVDSWTSGWAAPDAERFDDAVRRAHAYREAGAACVYPILLNDPVVIARFVDAAGGPVNILAMPTGPTLAEAARLGVARVSFGTRLFREQAATFDKALTTIAAEATAARNN